MESGLGVIVSKTNQRRRFATGGDKRGQVSVACLV